MGDVAGRGGQFRRALAATGWAVGVRPTPPPLTLAPGLETLCAALHRLDVERGHLAACDSRTPALFRRLLAASLAYDMVLGDTCRMLGVTEPGPPPLDGVARISSEAELHAAGLHW